MKLYEVTDVDVRKLTPKKAPTHGKAQGSLILPKKNKERLGAGSGGIVSSRKDDPGTVRKNVTARRELKNDGYFNFIKALVSSKNSNRYFPHIYDVNVTEADEEEVLGLMVNAGKYYAVDAERLHSLDTLEDDEAIMLIDSMFDVAHIVRRNVFRDNKQFKKDIQIDPHSMIVRILLKIFDADISKRDARAIVKDDELWDAIQFINNVVNSNVKFEHDIRIPNVMIRRGPGGPHIVLPDPVFP